MLGVDTNVLVRFLTADDPVQSPRSLRLMTTADNQPIHVCIVALVELVWVLTKVKRWPDADALEACRGLLQSGDFRLEHEELVARAIDDAAGVGCDLADALIALLNDRAGCEATATFDTNAQRLTRMVPVEERA